jgi:hypothetical protein
MTTDSLAKLYDRLRPFERLPLIIAAMNRGDDVEADRLVQSAPRIHVRLADYYGLADGLMRVTFSHMIVHFDLIVRFVLAAATVEKLEGTDVGKRKKAEKDLRMLGYRICVGADAWKRLCSEVKVEPEMLLGHLPGYGAMRAAEETARMFALTPEEAAACLRKSEGEEAELPTVEGSAKEMRQFIDERRVWWG